MQNPKQLDKLYLWGALALLFSMITIFSFAQKNEKEQVNVKIVKIVDGDTSVIEKSMEEASVKDFTKQFDNIKGKNVSVMVTVEGNDKDKNGKHVSCQSSCKSSCQSSCKQKQGGASSMHFNFDMDSATARSFSKAFMFNDSMMGKNFTWNDSLMKKFPKDFNFNFNFDDEELMKDFDFNINTEDNGKTMTIKNGNGKTIVINGDDEDEAVTRSEDGKTKTKTKTIVINDDKTNSKKKVIVSTSVIVMDMDDEKGDSDKKRSKEESNFSFYPNPSDGNFMLDLDMTGKEDAIVTITDMNGKQVYNEKITGYGKVSKSIDLSGKKGTFIVSIKQGKRTNIKKIIIE